MEEKDYPFYFEHTDKQAKQQQYLYLLLLKAEYLMAFLTVICLLFWKEIFFIFILFLCSIILLIVKNYWKFDREWYKNRGFAESIKTLTWKWLMSKNKEEDFKKSIRNFMENSKILVGTNLDSSEIVTKKMKEINKFSDEDKFEYYKKARITEQKEWYRKKIKENKKKNIIFSVIIGLLYISAAGCLLFNWKREITSTSYYEVTVIVCSIFASWINAKKYSELVETYTITFNDIILLENEKINFETGLSFSDYIDNCENAFSREHTQWYARKHN